MFRTLRSILFVAIFSFASTQAQSLLNVSYDPTRELYQDVNQAFIASLPSDGKTPQKIEQSHGGSGKQARSVIDGLEADVVTLALGYDIDQIAASGLVAADWQKRLPNNSCPYTSTVVFLVRKGNPKGIKDWNDLIRADVEVITPNPKTSGGARWNYLAAWGYALKNFGSKDSAAAKEFVKQLYARVPVLDTGARGSTTTFVQRGIGDVLISWENEALLAINELGADKVQLVVPSLSILAEPPVAVVDKNVAKHGTAELSKRYLEFLYTEAAQALIEKHFFRPLKTSGKTTFPKMQLFSLQEIFGSWEQAHKQHFADGAIFDEIIAGH